MPYKTEEAFKRLGDRITDIAREAAERITDDEKAIDDTISFVRQRVHTAVNEALEQHKMLSVPERSHIKQLKKREEHLVEIIQNRDEEKSKELHQIYGDKFVDFQQLELNAVRWALHFIEERSL
jgi:hypothetical protein